MVCSGDNSDEDENRVDDAESRVDAFLQGGFAEFGFLEGASENTGMVDQCAADDKGVAEMHTGHGSQGIDIVAAHPDAVGVVMSD